MSLYLIAFMVKQLGGAPLNSGCEFDTAIREFSEKVSGKDIVAFEEEISKANNSAKVSVLMYTKFPEFWEQDEASRFTYFVSFQVTPLGGTALLPSNENVTFLAPITKKDIRAFESKISGTSGSKVKVLSFSLQDSS